MALVPCIGPFTVWHFASKLVNYKTDELNLQKDFTIAYSGSDFSDEQNWCCFLRQVQLGYLFIEKKDQSCRRSCNRGNPWFKRQTEIVNSIDKEYIIFIAVYW